MIKKKKDIIPVFLQPFLWSYDLSRMESEKHKNIIIKNIIIKNILDKKRESILLFLEPFKNDFYLAGDTALALQIGHSNSINFDFFCKIIL